MNKLINCLMIKTIDQRYFFTHQKNLPQLVEFAKTCEAEVSVVKASNVKVLDLPELAKSICNHGKQSALPQYELLEVKIPEEEVKVERSRKKLLTQASIISSYVKTRFLSMKKVSCKDLETKFSEFGLTKAAISNHISKVRKNLEKDGYLVSKIKKGEYTIVVS